MALQVQLILPDNLNGTFLRGDFLQELGPYTSDSRSILAISGAEPDYQFNGQELCFKPIIIDTETREQVSIARIVSLRISNDPDFSPSNVIELVSWPEADVVYDPTKNYRRILNPSYWFDQTQPLYSQGGDGVEEPISSNSALQGYYFIDNWPLAGDGGLSTVYIQLTLLAQNSNIAVTYPNAYGVFDQIVWSSERPLPAGVPSAKTYSGTRSLWTFGASSDQATAVHGNGIDHYSADIFEMRPAGDSSDFVSSALSGATLRTLAPTRTANTATVAAKGYNAAVTSTIFLSSASASPDSGALSVLETGVPISASRKDIFAQAVISPTAAGSPGDTVTYCIGLLAGSYTGLTTSKAALVKLVIPSLGPPIGIVQRIAANSLSPTSAQTTTLPDPVALLARAGGLIELILSQRSGEANAIVRAYFTPHGQNEAHLLGACFIENLGNSITQYTPFAGFFCSGSPSFEVIELCAASGRALIGVKAAEEGDQPLPSATALSATSLAATLATDLYKQVDTPNPMGDEIAIVGETIQLQARRIENSTTASEVGWLRPSWSDDTLASISWTHLYGNAYVGFTKTSPPTESLWRSAGVSYDPSQPPGILVVFSLDEQSIYVVTRMSDGTSSKHKIAPYTLPANTTPDITWNVQVWHNADDLTANGGWLSLHRGAEFIGAVRLDRQSMALPSGMGWYVVAGVASSQETPQNDAGLGRTAINAFTVTGNTESGIDLSENQRAIFKGRPRRASQRLMGQLPVSSLTDGRKFGWAGPTGAAFADVQAVTDVHVPTMAAPNTVNNIPLNPGMRILVRNQANPVDNGIYVVESVGTGNNGAWSRVDDFATSADIVPGTTVQCAKAVVVAHVVSGAGGMTVTPATGTISSCPNTLDGVTLNVNDAILFLNTATPTSTGIYYVVSVGVGSNGNWSRSTKFNTLASLQPSVLVRNAYDGTYYIIYGGVGTGTLGLVSIGSASLSGYPSLEGTQWVLQAPQGVGAVGTAQVSFAANTVLHTFTAKNISGPALTTPLGLLELRIQANADSNEVWVKLVTVDSDTGITTGDISAWIPSSGFANPAIHGNVSTLDEIAAFDLLPANITVTPGNKYGLMVTIPHDCLLGSSEPSGAGTSAPSLLQPVGVLTTKNLWHRLFASRQFRRDNSSDGAMQQVRIQAVNHAGIISPSRPLSDVTTVDISAPSNAGGMPLAQALDGQTIRAASIVLEATDSVSGNHSFRVVQETSDGISRFGSWQRWSDYVGYDDLPAVKAATTAAVTLSGLGQTIDGVSAWSEGDRVLVKDQSTVSDNGVYLVAVDAWVRAADFDTDTVVTSAIRVFVNEGTTHTHSYFYVSLPSPNATPPYYVVGTSDIGWSTTANATAVKYVVYLFGEHALDGTGQEFTTALNENHSFDGRRRVWFQVMDAAGNISESDPLSFNAQGSALVDTTPPTASPDILLSSTYQTSTYTNNTSVLINAGGADLITEVREVRTRPINSTGPGSWSSWQLVGEAIPLTLTSTEGLQRIEVQVRDAGYNASQIKDQYQFLDSHTDSSVVFTSAARWQPISATQEVLFLGGTQASTYSDCAIVQSADPNYPNGNAYRLQQESGQIIFPRLTDTITLTVNSVQWTQRDASNGIPTSTYKSFYIDSSRGLMILLDTLPSGYIASANLSRKAGILYSWDGLKLVELAELSSSGEKGLLCAVACDSGVCFGGHSGKVWLYNGTSVTDTNLRASYPITGITLGRFPQDAESYVYVGTSRVGSLYRSAVSGLSSNGWEQLAITDTTLPTCSITSLLGAYDRVFIGTDANQIGIYVRQFEGVDADDLELDIDFRSMQPTTVALDKPLSMPISCLHKGNGSVLAGIRTRPEIWTCDVNIEQTADDESDWSTTVFDRWFINSPEPWQFLNSNHQSHSSETQTQTVWSAITDPNSGDNRRELLGITTTDGSLAFYTCGSGSDWEQAASSGDVYTIETSLMTASGSGKQSLRVEDGRFRYRLDFSQTAITFTSGSNVYGPITLGGEAFVSAMSEPSYPEAGVLRNWNFSSGEAEKGPYWTGDIGSAVSDNWIAGRGTSTATGEAGLTQTTETSSFGVIVSYLSVSPLLHMEPTITWTAVNKADGVQSTAGAAIYVRMRIVDAPQGASTRDAKLTIRWSNSPTTTDNELLSGDVAHISCDGDWHTYRLYPNWNGLVQRLALDLSGITEVEPDQFTAMSVDSWHWDIDYIAMVDEDSFVDLRDNLTPVRIAVSGTDVQVYVAGLPSPIIDETDALMDVTTKSTLSFGKLLAAETASVFQWHRVRWRIGVSESPVTISIDDPRPLWKFPSAGPVKQITTARGAVHAVLAGMNDFRPPVNPDFNGMSIFRYQPTSQTWGSVTARTPRPTTNTGVVDPLVAIGFNDTLIISGRQGVLS